MSVSNMLITATASSEQELLNILYITNGRFADVVEFNGRNGVNPKPPGEDEFHKLLEAAFLEFEKSAARKSAESSKEIESLRKQLNEKNLTLENVTKEKEIFQQKLQRCSEVNQQLTQESKSWSQKCDAELAKTMTLQQTLEEEKRVSTRHSQNLEDVQRRLLSASHYKAEGESASRVETEQYQRLITKLKGVIQTHGTGTGKPCDPAIFERKLQRVVEAVRSDCNRKFEEFKKKYDQLKKLEIDPKTRQMETEKANLISELKRLRLTFSSLEREASTMQKTIADLTSRISLLENLRVEVDKLRISINEIVAENIKLVGKYGVDLQCRARLQNGLNEYENLVIVEEDRISSSTRSSHPYDLERRELTYTSKTLHSYNDYERN